MTWPAEPRSPTTEEMKMIRPRRSRSMPLAARLASRKVPVRLVSMTEDQSSSLIRSSSVSLVMPALATSTSTGPWASSTCLKAASTASGSVMSQRTSRAPSGAPPLRVVTATLSPCATKASAMARPMPRLPPVTRTERGVLDPGISRHAPDASDYRGVAEIGCRASSSSRKPTFMPTWKCSTAPSLAWPRTWVTSNQSMWRSVCRRARCRCGRPGRCRRARCRRSR